VVASANRPIGRRRGRRVVLVGLLAAALVGLLGTLWEGRTLGWSTEQALARLETAVRREVDRRAVDLRARVAQALANRRLPTALLAREPDARTLFDLADRVTTDGDPSDVAVTIYDAQNAVVAWSGRPSGHVHEGRITGPQALFVAPSALGLRLVHVAPVMAPDARPDGQRVGAIVAEQGLSPATWGPDGTASRFELETARTSVTLTPGYAAPTATASQDTVLIDAPSGERLLQANLSRAELDRARQRARRTTVSAVLLVLAIVALFVAGIWSGERRLRNRRRYAQLTLAAIGAVVVARLLFWVALVPAEGGSDLVSPRAYSSGLLGWLHRTPLDLLVSAVLLLAILAISVDAVRREVLSRRGARVAPDATRATLRRFLLWQLAGGVVAAAVLVGLARLVSDSVVHTTADLLDLSLGFHGAARMAIVFALVVFEAVAVWTSVLVLRIAIALWRINRRQRWLQAATLAAWMLPAAVVCSVAALRHIDLPVVGLLLSLAFAALAAWFTARGVAWYRHGSQTLRLATILAALLVPAWLLYPSLSHDVTRARQRLIETQYAQRVLSHPEQLQKQLAASLRQIDAFPHLDDLLVSLAGQPRAPSTDEAFAVWRQTDLARSRLISSIELYAPPPQGALVSRFARNLPEYSGAVPPYEGISCTWEIHGEAAPFGAEERRLLHAGRAVCANDGEDGRPWIVGGIIVHVLFDYGTLPFLTPDSPYHELFRDAPEAERVPDRDVELVVYGWGRTPVYSSGGRAWPLADDVFRRAYQSRDPFWTRLERDNRTYDVYVVNDRNAIFTLGYPVTRPFGHLVRLAELTSVAGVVYLAVLLAGVALSWLRREHQPARDLVREIRTSFSRKLFLAFVAMAVIPVLTLAFFVRAFVATRLRANVEADAAHTATVARRVIEEAVALQQPVARGGGLTDDELVGISRVIEQDVNVFEGPSLVATSQRDLFASGLLPTRTPSTIYRAIVLERLPNAVSDDQIGALRYRLAAAPLRIGGREAILTVPLASQQQEIEREIDELDRGVHLGVILFILLGAGLGYSMAERIGDPVQRLTRASRRIAAGDLDARVVTRTADELQRLVEAFNSMAAELARQRTQLERTNRLEAWAEMARQVAHDIKNPLTPIQLAAEHLRRVHRDRGEPLGPVLNGCVDTILAQVRMLRQISGEFASFAASPAARLVPTDLSDVVHEVVSPYRVGLDHRVSVEVDLDDLPPMALDRVLLGRAMTNIMENAIHAMPGGGALRVTARRDGDRVRVAFTDTGVGMDDEARAHLFEPYFSTKATGTGLGLSIAKRNVELHGGTIEVVSRRGEGTMVTLTLPLDESAAEPTRRRA
jgi:signal transduction histidine kinase